MGYRQSVYVEGRMTSPLDRYTPPSRGSRLGRVLAVLFSLACAWLVLWEVTDILRGRPPNWPFLVESLGLLSLGVFFYAEWSERRRLALFALAAAAVALAIFA